MLSERFKNKSAVIVGQLKDFRTSSFDASLTDSEHEQYSNALAVIDEIKQLTAPTILSEDLNDVYEILLKNGFIKINE